MAAGSPDVANAAGSPREGVTRRTACGRLRSAQGTNAAAAGMSPAALMARAGHSDFTTTQLYIDLAGESFREEEGLVDAKLFGQKLGQK